MAKTPEEILAEAAAAGEPPVELNSISTEDIAEQEDRESAFDGYTDADRREEQIELNNDSMDRLVRDSQEISDETIDADDHHRG